MGNRANICITERNTADLYLYSHWDGEELAVILKYALKRAKDRWKDSPYLARVIFCDMIKGDVQGTTGFGISTYITDNEHNILYVNITDNTVKAGIEIYSFDDYINLSDNILRNLI